MSCDKSDGHRHTPRDLISMKSRDTDTTHDLRAPTVLPTTTTHKQQRRDTTYVRSIHCHRGGLQTILPSDSVCCRSGYRPRRSIIHSFQLRAYEQGTRARLSQVEDDLRSLRRERDDALRDLNASREQTQVWVAEVDKWKSEVCSLHISGTELCLPSSQANRASFVVKCSFAKS